MPITMARIGRDKRAARRQLPSNFPGVDIWLDGVVTSIKSIDLNAATYQDAARLTYRLNQYIDQLALYEGGELASLKSRPLPFQAAR